MSPIHLAPQDSVLVFNEVRAKRAIGMHWGVSKASLLYRAWNDRSSKQTWILTTEPVMDPPKRLAEECVKVGIPEGVFNVCGLGETVQVQKYISKAGGGSP